MFSFLSGIKWAEKNATRMMLAFISFGHLNFLCCSIKCLGSQRMASVISWGAKLGLRIVCSKLLLFPRIWCGKNEEPVDLNLFVAWHSKVIKNNLTSDVLPAMRKGLNKPNWSLKYYRFIKYQEKWICDGPHPGQARSPRDRCHRLL